MNDRLPPLTALRAFESAARHMSFARAAEELHVTPAALSFQIKSLEEHLGAQVFRRLNRSVELTEEGLLLQPGVSSGFEALQSAWRAVQNRLDSSTLTITAGPGFTAKWLAPRLFKFAQENADIELRFSASLRLMDFARDDIDVAIRFGQSEAEEGLFEQKIIDEWVVPMMSPDLAARVKTKDDLAALPFLHQDDTAFLRPKVDWPTYLEKLEVEADTASGPRFSQADHAVDAALAGGGAVLGRISLAETHIREGRLVAPLPLAMRANATYKLLCPLGAEKRPQVARFIEWVAAETASIKTLENDLTFIA